MFKPWRSELCHERSPWRNLWKPLGVMIIGTQIDSSGILLAYYAEGCLGICQSLWQMSKVQQRHQIRQPAKELTPMTTPWPFAQWGLDIIGSFLIAIRQLKFLIVGIDYFTKWIEAEALATITEKNVRSFVWKNIVCRYEIPRVLVSNTGK